MGWFGRAKRFVGRAIGTTGSVLKRVGELAAPVLKRVGDFAPVVADVVSAGAAALGQPEIVPAAQGIGKGLNWVGNAANKLGSAADKAQKIGGTLSSVSEKISGKG